MQEAVLGLAQTCRQAGAQVIEIELPESFADLIDVQKTIMAYEAAHNYVFETNSRADQVSAQFLALTEAGRSVGRESYVRAKATVSTAQAQLRALTGQVDAWISPAAIGEAPLATTGTGDPVMSRMWTALQGPSLCVPAGVGPSGLPLGVQLLANAGDDTQLLQVGGWVGKLLEKR